MDGGQSDVVVRDIPSMFDDNLFCIHLQRQYAACTELNEFLDSDGRTQHISRKCYLVDNGPGTESDIPTSGLKPELDNFDYTKEQSEEGYKYFTVIQCKIKSIEWLYLAAKGHRRARFDLENNKDNWLIP